MSDEYIRKQDASDWLKQYGQDVLHGKYKFSLMYIWKNIMDLPAADVVQVVRCKNCKYSEIQTFRGLVERLCFYNGVSLNINPDDFCCWGVRKEE